jgi:HAMP domain-containing protein
MGLRLKFNLVLVLVFALGLLLSGYMSRRILDTNAQDEVVRNADLMMGAALAMRDYTSKQVKPQLELQLMRAFLPQSVPAYAATEIFNALRDKHPEYTYKEATLNPTNPRDRAVEWEADIVQQFRNDSTRTEIKGIRDTPTGPSLYYAKPLKVGSPACIPCHDTPDTAPKSMVAKYGPANGFGWKLNEIVAAQIISVPMSVPLAKADIAFKTFMTSLVVVFVLAFLVLNAVLSVLVIRPIVKMSRAADEVSTGNFEIPEFNVGGKDEISVLATSFNRLRRSLEKAMKLLE